MRKHLALLSVIGFFLISCSSDDNAVVNDTTPVEPAPENFSSGSADFSNFVAVGNSLTAGFSDNSLFIDGQTASLPNMMAMSFAEVGGGEFTIPFVADNLGGLTAGGMPIRGNRLILSFASGSPAPVPVEGQGATEISQVQAGPFNNLGIPGAKSFHLAAPGYGNLAGVAPGLANPYYVRIASAPDATVIGDAIGQSPTFFSLWIGNNDVLSYATSGGVGVDQTGNLDPSTYGGNDITDPDVFASVYNGYLQGLTANGAQGVVANIPNVTDIPFFTTVPFAPLSPTNEDFAPQIAPLNEAYGGLNQVFAALGVPERSIVFSEDSASAVVIKDESLTDLSEQITGALIQFGVDQGTAAVTGFLYGQARQANENDLLVLTARNEIAMVNEEAVATLQGLGLPPESAGQLAVNGLTFPLEDQWVLTPDEQQSIATAVTAYNQVIANLATLYDVALVDANAYLNTFAESGEPLADGSTATATFGTGGGFSLDGVHPSPRGYALLANLFLEAIETKYGAVLPAVDPLAYKGLYIN